MKTNREPGSTTRLLSSCRVITVPMLLGSRRRETAKPLRGKTILRRPITGHVRPALHRCQPPTRQLRQPLVFSLLSRSFIVRVRNTSPSYRHNLMRFGNLHRATSEGTDNIRERATLPLFLCQQQKPDLRRCRSDNNDANISKTSSCAPDRNEWP